MGTTTEKLTYLQGTKDTIKNAIEAKGVEVPEGTTFRGYAEKIGEIPTEATPEWKTISVSGKEEGKYTIYEIKIPIKSKNQIVILYQAIDEELLECGISTENINDAVNDRLGNPNSYLEFIERTNEMVTFRNVDQFNNGDKVFTYIIV